MANTHPMSARSVYPREPITHIRQPARMMLVNKSQGDIKSDTNPEISSNRKYLLQSCNSSRGYFLKGVHISRYFV